ncbi:hypothetical protein [Nonomuraea pusilla]|uniref:Transcriptional regulator, TetR family n=1 Tax=Nonomuraea pusilla TaxID=46177 RepID=A0A1H7KS23_9ACTN|nr:hypothetical protein [Nonomuraea pusilla]SEK89316.1 transcriptional regulator, TetR family [Nonomuraea pusilla]
MIALGHRAHDRWHQALVSAGVEEAAASSDPGEVGRALDALLSGLIEVADEYGFGLTDHALAVHPELSRRAEELEEREIALYTAAQRTGLLRADLPVRWISNTVYGLLVAVRESLRRGDVARRDVHRLVTQTFLRGAASPAPEDGPRSAPHDGRASDGEGA